jgi:hypothetical protein
MRKSKSFQKLSGQKTPGLRQIRNPPRLAGSVRRPLVPKDCDQLHGSESESVGSSGSRVTAVKRETPDLSAQNYVDFGPHLQQTIGPA